MRSYFSYINRSVMRFPAALYYIIPISFVLFLVFVGAIYHYKNSDRSQSDEHQYVDDNNNEIKGKEHNQNKSNSLHKSNSLRENHLLYRPKSMKYSSQQLEQSKQPIIQNKQDDHKVWQWEGKNNKSNEEEKKKGLFPFLNNLKEQKNEQKENGLETIKEKENEDEEKTDVLKNEVGNKEGHDILDKKEKEVEGKPIFLNKKDLNDSMKIDKNSGEEENLLKDDISKKDDDLDNNSVTEKIFKKTKKKINNNIPGLDTNSIFIAEEEEDFALGGLLLTGDEIKMILSCLEVLARKSNNKKNVDLVLLNKETISNFFYKKDNLKANEFIKFFEEQKFISDKNNKAFFSKDDVKSFCENVLTKLFLNKENSIASEENLEKIRKYLLNLKEKNDKNNKNNEIYNKDIKESKQEQPVMSKEEADVKPNSFLECID